MKMNMTPRAKKLLAGLTAAALTLSMLPATALAAKDYATGGETALRFSNSGITVQEGDYDGYKIDGTDLTINAAGTYVLSGSCADGSVTVKKGTTGVVLVLDGLTLTCGDSAAIACNKSTEVTIVAADGTVNTLADTEQNNDETYPDNDSAENAVIKCKDGSQVTLCGSGTLNVTANGKNGVKSGATTDEEGAASLTIRELTLNIDAPVNDAVNAEQQLNIESGSLTISGGVIAVWTANTADNQPLDVSQTGSIGGFADNSSVSGYARTAMAWANGAGLISGMGDNTLAPRGTATRGQAAVILMGLDKLAGL